MTFHHRIANACRLLQGLTHAAVGALVRLGRLDPLDARTIVVRARYPRPSYGAVRDILGTRGLVRCPVLVAEPFRPNR